MGFQKVAVDKIVSECRQHEVLKKFCSCSFAFGDTTFRFYNFVFVHTKRLVRFPAFDFSFSRHGSQFDIDFQVQSGEQNLFFLHTFFPWLTHGFLKKFA